MIRTRHIAGVALLAVVVTAAAVSPSTAQTAYRSYRAEQGDAGTVRGPIQDFWFKVRSEWSGYREVDTAPNLGSGQVQQRTLQQAAPNRVWVSLVYGDELGNRKNGPLAHLYKAFLAEWKRDEGRNWPYAQIFGRPWSKMSSVGRRKNIIMIGTPWSLPPVGPLAEQLGFSITPGRVAIGERKYHGDNLILIFIAPNPADPEHYALVITGTGDEALLQAGELPYGETDYVLFRGRRLLEEGTLTKIDKETWGPPKEWSAQGSHHGFSIRETEHFTFWYETGRLPREELEKIVKAKEEAYESLAATIPPADQPIRITYYFYPSIDRKIDETSRDEPVHVDLADGAIHTVISNDQRILEPYLDLQVLLHRSIGPTRVPRLERALAIALAPDFQGRDVVSMSPRIFDEYARSAASVLKAVRDQSVRTVVDGPPSSRDVLLACFMRYLVKQHGAAAALDFVANATPKDLKDPFRRAFGIDVREALKRWISTIDKTPLPPPPVTRSAKSRSSAEKLYEKGMELVRLRHDPEATSQLQAALKKDPGHPGVLAALARLSFRNGRFDESALQVLRVLDICSVKKRRDECGDAEAWSRLTLGRIEAVRGMNMAAAMELTHPAVVQGPTPIPTLADFWLQTMGQSRNQLTVINHLKRESRVSLRRLDWSGAERQLKKALELDPTDGEAHRLLSEVYHKQHEYWAWKFRFLNQIHPDYLVTSRIYTPGEYDPVQVRVENLHSLDSFNDLVLKGNLELMKAQSLYAVEIQNLHAEGDRYLIELRDLDESLRIYRRALELNEDFFLSHFLVGRCYFLMDRLADARDSFEEVLMRRPKYALVQAWTHTYLGYISIQEDDLRSAQRSFRRALDTVDEGQVAGLAREGLGRVETIQLLTPNGPSGR